jgi:hypothetical protein
MGRSERGKKSFSFSENMNMNKFWDDTEKHLLTTFPFPPSSLLLYSFELGIA